MKPIKVPTYSLKIKSDGKRKMIFDEIRRKYVIVTPEEVIRQNFITYLVREKGYPSSLIAVEMSLKVNNLNKRSDIVMFNKKGEPLIIAECKAPGIKISQEVFDQVARYNIPYRVEYLVVTNGKDTYCCKLDFDRMSFSFVDKIPTFMDLTGD